MKLLLHACCAPCSIQCALALASDGIQLCLLWYNPNIHPYSEYCSRLDALRKFAGEKNLLLINELNEYPQTIRDNPCNSVMPFFNLEKPERCVLCYRVRLEKTVQAAAKNGYDAFSTTLLISPYQNHELLRQIGDELTLTSGPEFLYRDFRSLFRKGQSQAREAGYYMQKHCGCFLSKEERYNCGQKANNIQ